MNKITNLLLGLILIGIVLVGFEMAQIQPTVQFGYSGYNDLGYSGVTNSSTTVATSTTKVFSANSARIYAKIGNTGGSNAVYCKMTTASTTVALYEGIAIPAAGSYEIGVDNLWKGEIWCLAATSPVVVSTVEK